MKSRLLTAAIGLLALTATGQDWRWPMAGREVGSNILYAPQSFIDRELNFGSMIVGGDEGDVIVAPFDGKVGAIFLSYIESLTSSSSSDIDFSMDFDASRRDFVKGTRKTARFVSHEVFLNTADGRTLTINGLKLKRKFQSGERIAAGDTLGTLEYCYWKVPQPSVMISVSYRGKPSDPMSVFGLPTTFKAPEPVKPVKFLTPAQVKEDFTRLTDAIIDCYPSLDELMTREALIAYRDSVTASVTGNVDMLDFMKMMSRTSAFIHDSHISFWPSWGVGRRTHWNLYLGRVGDSIRVVSAVDGFTGYLNRGVRSIDGISPDSVLRHTARFVSDYDALSEGYIRMRQFWGLTGLVADNFPGKTDGFTVTLDNGETVKINRREGGAKLIPGRGHIWRTNKYDGTGFATRMLNDSTAYIGISTFSLDEVSVDSIRDFISRNLHIPHMIVDVRNNGGGDDRVLKRLLTYFNDKPYATLRHSSKVNRRGHFPMLAHSRNYSADSEIFGDEYVEEEGREGFYCHGGETTLMPDSEVAYGGRLYVLVDEMSCSAATLFPAYVMRSHRGVVVGRETRTAYRYMTALKFADFTLPHSMVNWRIPLVKCILDETESPRIPRGRGVIPDVMVPLGDTDLAGGDAILDRALHMIADGEYLGPNPF